MSRILRIAIYSTLALLFIFLAGNRVSQAISGALPDSSGVHQLAALPPAGEGQEVPVKDQPNTASLDGLVWNDLNRNGLQDLEEPGIRDVVVNLLTSTRTMASTTTTDKNGAFRFHNLAPGDYFVSVVPPTGFVLSLQDQGENELVDSDPDPATAESQPVTLVAGENGLVWTAGVYDPAALPPPDPGTVQPPPTDIEVCTAGVYSLGGVSTLEVNQLAPDYCVHAFLWNHGFAIGRIPGGAGNILAEVTFVEFFYQGNLVYSYDVPGQTDSIQVCYNTFGRDAQIYFFDFYGPRFGQRTGQPAWVPLETTIEDGIACAVAQTSGAYALIGK